MAYIDEAIIKLRTKEEQKNWMSTIDLTKEQILYGESYHFTQRLFFEDILELLVPEAFFPMPEDIAAQKYLSAQRPQVILTNHGYTIDITLNLLEGTLKDEQVHLCLQKLQNAIREAYPATLFYDVEQMDLDGLTLAYMDFKSFSLAGPLYNVMFVTALDEQPLIGTLNCPFEQWEQWRPVAIEMLRTIRKVEEKP